jgi:hypothetical protein
MGLSLIAFLVTAPGVALKAWAAKTRGERLRNERELAQRDLRIKYLEGQLRETRLALLGARERIVRLRSHPPVENRFEDMLRTCTPQGRAAFLREGQHLLDGISLGGYVGSLSGSFLED